MPLWLPIVLPIGGGAAIFALRDDRLRRAAVTAVVLLTAMAAVSYAFLPEQQMTVLRLSDELSITFGVDGVTRFFLVLVALIWSLVQFYAFGYMPHEGKQAQFFGFYCITLGVLVALAMAQNMVTLYMCFELMTLLSMPLVLHSGTEESRRAAMKYVGYSVLGAALALLGFFFLAQYAETTAFVPGGVSLRPGHAGALLTAYFLMVVGFGCKAGLLPLQAWLTTAHPVAPSPASAVLSGVITKGGVLAVLRVTFFLFGPDFIRGSWAQLALLCLTLATVFTGSMLALKAKLLKKRLAYSTISQVSYALFGLLLLTEDGFTGALLQVAFHALAKDALFLAAGAMILQTGVTAVEDLRGVGRRMPVTLWCFALAALSLIGIPPAGGFISKWYLALGALGRGDVLGVAGVGVLLLSALLTAFYLLPIVTAGFFPGRDFDAGPRCEAAGELLLPMLVFSALTVVLGAFPGALTRWIQALASSLL